MKRQSMTLICLLFSYSGLQDNPWFCDCKISKMIEISKMPVTPVVLMDLYLTCSGPENLAGVLFQRVELDNCVKPSVMTSATRITSPLGSNVLLRCDTTGTPTPSLNWVKSDGSPVDNTGTTCRLLKERKTMLFSDSQSLIPLINYILCIDFHCLVCKRH